MEPFSAILWETGAAPLNTRYRLENGGTAFFRGYQGSWVVTRGVLNQAKGS